MSKITSPFQVLAYLAPGDRGRIWVELLRENGDLLTRKVLVFNSSGRKVNLFTELDFGIAGVAELGRLQIYVKDPWDRITSLGSVNLILLSNGESEINAARDFSAPIIIKAPRPNTLVKGDQLQVSGLANSSSDQPLFVELIARNGKLLGSRLVAVSGVPDNTHHPFEGTVDFQVSELTQALVVVQDRGGRIPGTRQLTSLEVVLSP